MCPVILSRSEGSLSLDDQTVFEDRSVRLPNQPFLLPTPGDPSLRLRMTGHIGSVLANANLNTKEL
jgi:hypothetical protein